MIVPRPRLKECQPRQRSPMTGLISRRERLSRERLNPFSSERAGPTQHCASQPADSCGHACYSRAVLGMQTPGPRLKNGRMGLIYRKSATPYAVSRPKTHDNELDSFPGILLPVLEANTAPTRLTLDFEDHHQQNLTKDNARRKE